MYKFSVLGLVICIITFSHASEGQPDFGYGLQILGKAVRHYLNSQINDVKLGEGVHLINIASPNDARANTDDGTIIGALENYLRNHEVKIQLPELMPEQGFGRAFKDAMEGFKANENGTGRGKDKNGAGGIMILGLMMGKMMAALGLGGVGLLAMKALMVSALALMLSMVIGIKKLVSSGQDDGGGYHVIHASGHGHEHRRKREAIDMAYRAWKQNQTS